MAFLSYPLACRCRIDAVYHPMQEEVITFQEFKSAMLKWLTPATSSGGAKRAIRAGSATSAADVRTRVCRQALFSAL